MDNVIFTPTLPQAFEHAGLAWPGEPIPGRVLRFSTNDRDRADRAGWCKLLPDESAAAFGDWRSGASFVWQRRDIGQAPPTHEERTQARQRAAEAQREAEAEREAAYAQAARESVALWAKLEPAPADHPYLAKKGIRPDHARLHHDGRLTLPVFDAQGQVQSLQFIAADGAKRFYLGGKMKAGRLYLGQPRDAQPIVLAEGFATGASAHESTGMATVCAFSGSNLAHVAESLRRLYPASPLLVAGDRDAHGAGQRYAEAAAAAGAPAKAVLPVFKDGRESGDWNDLAHDEGQVEVKSQLLAALNPPSRFNILDADDYADDSPTDWLVKGLLPRRGLAAVYGPSGCGKSFLILDLLAAVASGSEWFGFRTVKAPVLYICLEGAEGVRKRLAAYRQDAGSLTGIKLIAQPLGLGNAQDETDLINAVRAHGLTGGIVCIDTLAAATAGMDENSGSDMTDAISTCQRIQAATDTLFVMVHHTGKNAAMGLRGHSSLIGALDASIEVSGGQDGIPRQWEGRKVKDDSVGDPYPFELRRVVLGLDADGDEISSCVIEPTDAAGDVVRRVKVPHGGNQKIIWDGLGEMLKSARYFGEGGAPPTRPCVKLDDAIHGLRDRLTCPTDRQTERTRLAITGLITKGLVVHREGWLWLS